MKKQRKPREPRNNHAINAHMRNSAGVMDNKKRKKQKICDSIRDDLDEALDSLLEAEQKLREIEEGDE